MVVQASVCVVPAGFHLSLSGFQLGLKVFIHGFFKLISFGKIQLGQLFLCSLGVQKVFISLKFEFVLRSHTMGAVRIQFLGDFGLIVFFGIRLFAVPELKIDHGLVFFIEFL